MAAWGVTGVIGAALAWTTSPGVRAWLRRWRPGSQLPPDGTGQPWIGRWPLAIVCFVVGFAFTVVQDIGDWVTYSDHSWQQFGIYVGKGLGFDAIHATGCLLFALAFGPALTRAIQRFARRLQVRWLRAGRGRARGRGARRGGTRSRDCERRPAARAASGLNGPVSYLLGAENSDGGFGAAPGQSSNPLYSGWAALGLASAGRSPARARAGIARAGRLRPLLGRLGAGRRLGRAHDSRAQRRRSVGPGLRGERPGRDARASHPRRRVGRGAGEPDLVRRARAARRSRRPVAADAHVAGPPAEPRRRLRLRGEGAPRATSTTPARRSRRSPARGSPARRARARGRSPTCAATRTATAASRPSRARDPTPSRRPGRSRDSMRSGSTRRRCTVNGAVSPLAYLRGLIAANGSIAYSRGVHQTPVWVTGEALMALEGKPLPLAHGPRRRPRRADTVAGRRGAATSNPRTAASSDARPMRWPRGSGSWRRCCSPRRGSGEARAGRRLSRRGGGANRYPAPPHEDRCPEGDCRR